MNPWMNIVLVLLALGGTQFAVTYVGGKHRLDPELMRKIVHIVMGLVCAPFPWLFASIWPVVLLTVLALLWLHATKYISQLCTLLGPALGGVERQSHGETWFCLGLGTLFWLADNTWLLYVVPLLILTFADAAAALIGKRYGTTLYRTLNGTKSLEGSLAFCATAWLCTLLALMLFGAMGSATVLLIGGFVAIATTLLEAVSGRGSDNIVVPLGGFAALNIALELSPNLLVLLFGAMLVAAGAFFVANRPRASSTTQA